MAETNVNLAVFDDVRPDHEKSSPVPFPPLMQVTESDPPTAGTPVVTTSPVGTAEAKKTRKQHYQLEQLKQKKQ